MAAEVAPRRSKITLLWFVVGVLLVQFFLRAHHPTELPFFWDENRHMVRAASILDGKHPAETSNGKFLLYVWIAPFHPDRPVALHVSRTAVALFSLLGTAGLFALTRRLFGVLAACVAIAFYATVPFALFYERMVLADGLAGALGILTAWQAVRFAQRVTYRRAALVGALAALAVMAKLTMTFAVVLMPVLSIVLLGKQVKASAEEDEAKQRRTRFAISLKRFVLDYWKYWAVAGIAFIVMWLPTLIPAAISGLQGHYYVLVDQSLISDSALRGENTNRFAELMRQLVTMLSWPMVLALGLAVILGLWGFPGRTTFVLVWLILVWFPGVALVWRTQTRYLMPGVYPLAVLLGAGIAVVARAGIVSKAEEDPNREVWQVNFATRLPSSYRGVLVSGLLGIWMLVFALPFARTASTDAAALDMPQWDQRDYYQQPWNGYGLLSALRYIDENGQVAADGKTYVIGVAWMCRYMDLYSFAHIDLTCLANEYDGAVGGELWQAVIEQVEHHQPLYLMLEQHRNTLEIPEIPFEAEGVEWIKLAAFQRPKDGLWVTVWQATHEDGGSRFN